MMFRVLSWGCGLQSTALAVMSMLGILPPLNAIIHADTQWERQETVDSREWYTRWLEERGMEIHVVTIGNIRHLGATAHIHMPLWTNDGGPLGRQCTREFKVRPIKRLIRELMGFHCSLPPHPKKDSVELWLGITTDEKTRANKSPVQFIKHRWPLLEMAIERNALPDWFKKQGLPAPPKSACIGCPYRKASEWIKMREDAPHEWQDALAFDEQNRNNPLAERDGSTADELFVWREGEPLVEADLEYAAKKERQFSEYQRTFFLCESGYCDA